MRGDVTLNSSVRYTYIVWQIGVSYPREVQ